VRRGWRCGGAAQARHSAGAPGDSRGAKCGAGGLGKQAARRQAVAGPLSRAAPLLPATRRWRLRSKRAPTPTCSRPSASRRRRRRAPSPRRRWVAARGGGARVCVCVGGGKACVWGRPVPVAAAKGNEGPSRAGGLGATPWGAPGSSAAVASTEAVPAVAVGSQELGRITAHPPARCRPSPRPRPPPRPPRRRSRRSTGRRRRRRSRPARVGVERAVGEGLRGRGRGPSPRPAVRLDLRNSAPRPTRRPPAPAPRPAQALRLAATSGAATRATTCLRWAGGWASWCCRSRWTPTSPPSRCPRESRESAPRALQPSPAQPRAA
jgi:hypothetical protein